MPYYIDYPADWIGVPRFGAGEVFADPQAWSTALVDEIAAGARPRFGRKDRAQLADVLATLVGDLAAAEAQAIYLWLETLRGPVHGVVTRTLPGQFDDETLDDLAGARGDRDYVPPIVRDAGTDSGLRGVYVERHAPLDDDAPLVAVISGTFAFRLPSGVVFLSSSSLDLAGFERFRPHFEEFARTLRWEDDRE